jgi:mono/diheme cytochrome c family protein
MLLIVPPLCAVAQQSASQQKPNDKPAATAPGAERTRSETEAKNPVKPTPESLTEAKKIFGYDCAMCHGVAADGKGDLAASMGLKMSDWRESEKLAALSDGELFNVIVKGKGRMIGEGDRYSTEKVWGLVNYLRTFSKNEVPTVPKAPNSH